MKKDIQQLADRVYSGEYTLPDGTFVSESRLNTIKRVAHIAWEIKPGNNSQLQKMVQEWRKNYSDSTVKLYLDICKQAVKGKDYLWPKLKQEQKEPTPIPVEIAKQIIADQLPDSFDQPYDTDCFTAAKLAINSCLRPIDAVTLTIENIGDGYLVSPHQKTKRVVRSEINPSVMEWIAERTAEYGDLYSHEWRGIGASYRKRILKEFLLRLLDYYGVAEKVMVGMDAGSVSRYKLKDVITAKSLRSTGANLLLSMGVPAHDVMAIGGWSSYDIFRKHYLKPNIEVWKL